MYHTCKEGNEVPKVVGEAKEGLELLSCVWSREVGQGKGLVQVRSNGGLANNEAKHTELLVGELALGSSHMEVGFGEGIEHCIDVLNVRVHSWEEDEQVVHIVACEVIELRDDDAYGSLDMGCHCLDAKGSACKHPAFSFSGESELDLVWLMDRELVEAPDEVKA